MRAVNGQISNFGNVEQRVAHLWKQLTYMPSVAYLYAFKSYENSRIETKEKKVWKGTISNPS